MSRVVQSLLTPWWAAELLTGAKSFLDNPLIGSPRLNAKGLHGWRVAKAHAMTDRRREKLAAAVDPSDVATYARDGFVAIENFLPADTFAALRDQTLAFKGPAREMVQGDAITRRYAIDPDAIRAMPAVKAFRDHPRFQALARYIASFDVEPLLYIQSILTHRFDAPPDPQVNLHADTFHPTMKAWFFLENVAADEGPFTYVPGSHRLTPARLDWEKRRSLSVRDEGDRLSARGSFRIERQELTALGLPQPISLAVPANTLVVADTFGFHARGEAAHRSTRIELWAYSRRNPFLPFSGLDPWSLPGIAERRIPLLWLTHDIYKPLIGQAWAKAGRKRPGDE
ncbi:phytanoyl-CoA dioxygenase family protein [Sphingomonas montanisoli]|uniref:Phytanoyl-CoA dioxygenase family protein n=1 Tax=Sphingomonas montanisoli TaxID=2606412 RepID=A0A5D9BXF9_9SPHN|nr:phytanoyl-CoA dioxygenase family protein [Sphingomonas montanisoli]TZG24179.1 phytanoyl-CoA dioxygenase family protein [Sphingomonas montanisoli]